MARVHSTAIVDPAARLGEGVEIGPYCVVGPEVELGEGVRLLSHVVLEGRTRLGPRVRVFPFASVGHAPQDLKYKGEKSRLEVGADTVIREHATLNPGTEGGGMLTRVGEHCLLMVGCHVAHDCRIGNNVIMANNATLGGHVVIEDFAFLGGMCAVHQFVRIGRHAMVGGMSGVENDVIPYGSVMGDRARLGGLNLVGLKRRGFSRDDIHALRTAYRLLFAQEGTMAERIDDVARLFSSSRPVQDIIDFIRAESQRTIIQPRAANAG
ncbi:MAG: acyl-ACP--UDP-N-acetylglucosamine O-acyltransferase [Alphaproteobacteria bacterium]|nr:acyl-ACP--UDP-N-acetylglucosamine O-acyltransferase [Alphaproteobacteria bacterium]